MFQSTLDRAFTVEIPYWRVGFSLVMMTASAGYVAGSGERIDWQKLGWTSLGTFCAAACANTLNQLYEIANDRAMSRTCTRPLPTGRMSRLHAAAFAVATGAAGLAILYTQVGRPGFRVYGSGLSAWAWARGP